MFATQQMTSQCVADCDKRIASLQTKINGWKMYSEVLSLASGLYDKEEDKSVFKMEDKNTEKIRNYENNIQLVKVEKLIYQTLGKGANGVIFQKLFQKYSDLMASSYDISGNMVRLAGISEGEYLEYCKESLQQREYIQALCLYGEKL
jgi:hypothetical protein